MYVERKHEHKAFGCTYSPSLDLALTRDRERKKRQRERERETEREKGRKREGPNCECIVSASLLSRPCVRRERTRDKEREICIEIERRGQRDRERERDPGRDTCCWQEHSLFTARQQTAFSSAALTNASATVAAIQAECVILCNHGDIGRHPLNSHHCNRRRKWHCETTPVPNYSPQLDVSARQAVLSTSRRSASCAGQSTWCIASEVIKLKALRLGSW